MTTQAFAGEQPGLPMMAAARQVAPIVMGYLPVGAAYGVLAQQAGLSLLNTVLMSVLVYAGSAQLIAVAMFAAGLNPVSIIATTFVVNLRHLLMSASLAPNLKSWNKWELALFAYEVTDESFAVHSVRFARGDLNKTTCFGINGLAQVSWVVASFAGYFAGASIPSVEPLGIDYALPAMFIALLVMQMKNGLHILVAGFSGLLALILNQAGAAQWSVILATVLGATFGAGVESWTRKIVFLTIVGMLAVTYVPRMVPLVALASRTLPESVVRWLSYVPAAVLSSMLFPALLLKDGTVDLTPDNYFLWAAVPAFILARRTKSFFGTVAPGMALVAAGRYFLG